jgi:hypothetical protein
MRLDAHLVGHAPMIHYWGAQAIVQRIGLRDARRVAELVRTVGLPAFLRRDPKRPCCRKYYSDEALMSSWLLARATVWRQELIAKETLRNEKKLSVQRLKEKSSRREANSENV